MASSYTAQKIVEENEEKLRRWGAALSRLTDAEVTVFIGHATGLAHHQYPGYGHLIKEGDYLDVVAHPDNKYDANAIGLNHNARQIGWIPKALNSVAARAKREGRQLVCKVLAHHTTTDDIQRRLSIEVRALPRKTTQPTQEQYPMAIKSVNSIIEKNVSLGTSAAFLEAGRIANSQLSQIAGKKLPIMVRAYADTALGRLLLANVALMARDHFRPEDERLGKLVNAMAVSAYQEVLQNFDIEQMIEDLISNSTIKKALKSIDSAEAKAS